MIEIVPAIDIIDGKCVRLTQGDYAQKSVYAVTAEDMVLQYLDSGLHRVHVVDLDGAKSASPRNLRVLERLARIDGAQIEWGGGVKSDSAVRDVLNAGATYVVIGSVAVQQPEKFAQWLGDYGAERMILGADVRNGMVAVNGWLEQSTASIDDLLTQFSAQLTQVICTDISKDGMLQGPAFELYGHLQAHFPDIQFTASGGISNIDDIARLNDMHVARVIVGKAIYEQRITLQQITQFNASQSC
jgi:phosphoribosylformimino-5-aminoimidazole carboxamide ribotide isomerase